MNHWFIGDSVIIRYSAGTKRNITVHPYFAGEERGYRVTLNANGSEVSRINRFNLIDALKIGEEWLP